MKKHILVIILIFTFFFLSVFCTYSLEVSSGKLKLILHENIGRFSLYYLHDAENSKYTPFFTDQDPRTSTLSVVINNKVYRLGDSFSFKETAEETTNGAKFTWRSNQLEVTQEFSFIKSITSTESDGIKISIIFTNISEEDLEVGARFILDTNLGESDSIHFKNDSGSRITKETKIESTEMIEYFNSPKNDDIGLMVVTDGTGISKPDVIIFANWKRLNDTSWSYSTSADRNFNLPPYSINDSAVCLYYFPQPLSSGLSSEITMVMGNYSESGFVVKKSTTTIKTSANATDQNTSATTSNESNTSNTGTSTNTAAKDSLLTVSIKGDISTLETVLEEIDKKITDGTYTEKDIDLLEKIITELNNKAKKYSQN